MAQDNNVKYAPDGYPIHYWKPGDRLKESWNYRPNGDKILFWEVMQTKGVACYKELDSCP